MMLFSQPSITELEDRYVIDAMHTSRLSGDGKYTKRVYEIFRQRFGVEDMLLTTSGTAALELAALLIGLEPGDEVIAPSFTFSSTINAFLLRGARPVFCDIRQDTFNIDEEKIEALITPKTKAIYCVNYAGVSCEMDRINEIADRHGLFVVEDAAQSVGSTYKGKPSGTLSELGCYSFHETKNYVMGEGGAIVLNEKKYIERAEMIREKGTDRSKLLRGMVDKYTWRDIGSSYLPSDILAAMLTAQLERFDEIMEKRMRIWDFYQESLKQAEEQEKLRQPIVPGHVTHNGHMYNILLPSERARIWLGDELRELGIPAYICYVPLHSSPMGRKLGYVPEDCPITEDLGNRILRLPLSAMLTEAEAAEVTERICELLPKMPV
ncbi:MAG: dTDP-4-amino-4,6-dideoxygalactose transaminase [Ruminococcus sp.]|nr:dTDP-4-amino-4,6-dideoxygalactose transaminase [Ruminococcus sp.]